MKHASEPTLRKIEPLLNKIRLLPRIKEKKLGIFYLNSKAFLHFHDDPSGLYADYRQEFDTEFVRVRVSTLAEQKKLLQLLRTALKDE